MPATSVTPVTPVTRRDANRGGIRMEDLQREHIRATLEEVQWRVEGHGGAAELLGMNPNTLRGCMRKLGIHRRGSHMESSRLH